MARFKVGDKVRVKTVSEMIELKDDEFVGHMFKYCGTVVTIKSIFTLSGVETYDIEEDGGTYIWYDEYFVDKVSLIKKRKYERVIDKKKIAFIEDGSLTDKQMAQMKRLGIVCMVYPKGSTPPAIYDIQDKCSLY